jgi:hypothetical protein
MESDGSEYVELQQCQLHKAAPDLLAACEALILEFQEDTGWATREERDALEQVKAAIEKARGEA